MPSESDSEHDAGQIAPEAERLGPSDERFDASARPGNARAPHTQADASDWIESFRDVHFTWNERGLAGEPERSSGDDWWRSIGELNTEIDAEPRSDTTASSPEAGEWWPTPDEQLAFARNSPTLPAESDGLTRAAEPASDAGAAGPAGAEPGRRGAEFRKRRRVFLVAAGDVPKPWDRLRDAAFALAHQIAEKSPIVIRAAKESLNGVLAERGRRGAWMLAGFAALAILVAGTAVVVVVTRSDGARPAGKIVSDRTTAPTTTTAPVTTTAPAPETSVPASPAPSAAPTAPRTTTTSRRTLPANPGPAVTPPPPPPDATPEPPPPDATPEPPPPPPPPLSTSPPTTIAFP